MADDIKIVGLSSKKTGGTNWKVISAIVGIIVLSIGVIAGIFLVRQQQDIREKASGNCTDPKSIVKCPAPDGNLYSCNPPDSNNNAQISQCNVAGRVELCGIDGNIKEYCCPSVGGAWTTDMTACSCKAAAPTGLKAEVTSGTTVKLKWTPGTGGTDTRLWVSKNSDPTGGCTTGGAANCIVNDQKFAMTAAEFELTGLTADTKYYWRMMTSAGSGCDSGTSVLNFTTTVGGASATPTATSTGSAVATATSTSASTNKTATPTATSTAKGTTTAKATSTTKATSTAKATGSGTAFPVPETGADFPTVIGFGFGIVMVLISLALAL